MKKILPVLLVASLMFGNCSKSNDGQPAATPLLGTWNLQSETIVTTRNGAPATTNNVQITSPITVEYLANGVFIVKNHYPRRITTEGGTYTFANNVITLDYSNNGIMTSVLSVSELTDTRLVTVETRGDTNYSMVTTDTLTR
ncbi:lipocalin family protein [Hymenobacter negativus]|uniref:Lipocalin family protein n=1 Tax=Hymenobacter negativus TaxID=2795026 RepID=A0ABS3QIM5_9BACT|nr:lipocalin family protein [Hymenobacter negativus]MBO2010853.1 lipocalin family protein [Hymenobacter negativus]